MRHRTAALAVLAALLTAAAHARVLSYAPYSDRSSTPGVQHRMNRHFVVYEQDDVSSFYNVSITGQVVMYDSKGEEEPRVVFPPTGAAYVAALAMREEPGQPAQILVNAVVNSGPITNTGQWYFSNDGGASWKTLGGLGSTANGNGYYGIVPYYSFVPEDVGGPFARGRGSNIRIGTRDLPFVVATYGGANTTINISSVGIDGTVKTLTAVNSSNPLIGSDLAGRRFLLRDQANLLVLDAVSGSVGVIGALNASGFAEGWLTSDGAAIVELRLTYPDDTLWLVKNGTATFIAGTVEKSNPMVQLPTVPYYAMQFFAVPTADYDGAWFVNRLTGQPTSLSKYTQQTGVVKQWTDVSAPEVEALHPSAKGDKVLIQVHRPRQTVDALLFKDPAIAVWHTGDSAPRGYDELFLSESNTKGFVHLDVDAIESGAPFVFDSGLQAAPNPILVSPPPVSGGGGSDVIQEWGVVRASLQQKLVLPGAGRTPGAYGSFWRTDVTFYNPSDGPVGLTVEYRPTGEVRTADLKQIRLVLAAKEVRTVVDSLKGLFQLESGVGAYFITPDANSAVSVTSRTYTTSSKGTYGYGMNGIDVYAAASPRFPVTFAGAFQGSDFRTNAFVTDVSGRGSDTQFNARPPFGSMASFATRAPGFGVQQVNGVTSSLGLASTMIGALQVRPQTGEAIASVFTVDNRTNDPTFFPPDLPASVVRVIPAIAHTDGANGSKYRSDLYLLNTAGASKQMNIQLRLWDGSGPFNLSLTLLPNEARVIPDVLFNAFGKEGIGRLRVWSFGSASDTSVRVTSRTYTVDEKGGTYGFLMPPLNSFQEAAAGETLEIIGPALDSRFRTNLGLVDIAAFSSTGPVARIEIFDDFGKQLDKFDITLPPGGGTQINDLFHGRGLPDSGQPMVIHVTAVSGMVGAYAATNDNGTNDPTYVAANLASRQ